MNTYFHIYGNTIKPTTGQDEWSQIDIEPPLQLVFNAKPSRPKKVKKEMSL